MKRKGIRPGTVLGLLILVLLVAGAAAFVWGEKLWLEERGHGDVRIQSEQFTESARELRNPERGFYHMHGFRITDEETDFRENVAKRYCRDHETTLTLVEINLQYFREGPISDRGLANLEALFDAYEAVDKKLIVRFLYDWNGENEQYEPESLDIILEHIRQVGPVLKEHSSRIYALQGLFVGNWGEMNGTRYLSPEELQALAEALEDASGDGMFFSVRMPMQWRIITGCGDPKAVARGDENLASRLGLYNDGMLGSWSDYGTYGDRTAAEHGLFTYWNREEELAFQEELCKLVPIGGEVMTDNPYNDLENAIQDMSRMHVTYINRDFDTKVLDKWAASTVSEEGCFDKMDGLTYVERHLGYRLLIRDTVLTYDLEKDSLSVDVELQNVGFAPVYYEKDVWAVLYREDTGQVFCYPVEGDIRDLAGGTEAEQTQSLHADISLKGQLPGTARIYFTIRDPDTGEQILLANEQEADRYGYLLGTVELASTKTLRGTFWDKVTGEEHER
ncbi:MAG: DUF4832 domain-containing protein [Lachnospiraceae bacterium]|nr:DUF4832 domain-containing protein [Lachnospiraceae bacterium]